MAGVKGMFDRASKSPAYAQAVRDRIKAGGILFCLHEHIVGKREMSPSQVTAALGLLRKVVPDKSETKLDGIVRHGPLLTLEQAAEMAEAVIERGRRTTVSASEPDSVHDSKPA